jgi:PhnB protein
LTQEPQPPRTGVFAELAVRRGREAVEFYRAAFGAVEVYRVGGTDEHEAVVSELRVGESTFWVHDESPEHGSFTVRLLLVVEDPDSAFARALAAGATEVRSLVEEHRWLLGCVEDPFGHRWEIGRPLVAWPPGRGGG